MTHPPPSELTPMGSSKAWAFGCLGVSLALSMVGCVVPLFGLFVAKPDAWIAFIVMSVAVGGGFFALMIFSMYFTSLMRRGQANHPVLKDLQARYGGTIHMPRFTAPMLVPCWIGPVEGAQARVTLNAIVRRHGDIGGMAMRAAINASQEWKLPSGSHQRFLVAVNEPAAFTLAAVCRTSASTMGQGLFGGDVREWRSGYDQTDADFVFFTDRPDLAAALLAQDGRRLVDLLAFNAPWITNVRLSPNGAHWHGVNSEHTTPGAVGRVVADLVHLSRQTGGLAP